VKCENRFCIYFKKGECSLKEITLDIQGICTECIYVDIPEETLDERRLNILSQNK